MAKGNSYAAVAVLILATIPWPTLAAIGPVTDLAIVNGPIAPDGVSRNAVLADGIFPGPVISGYTVCYVSSGLSTRMRRSCFAIVAGRRLQDQRQGRALQHDHADGHQHRECLCQYRPDEQTLSETWAALARPPAAHDELGGWGRFCQPMPYHLRQLLRIQVRHDRHNRLVNDSYFQLNFGIDVFNDD